MTVTTEFQRAAKLHNNIDLSKPIAYATHIDQSTIAIAICHNRQTISLQYVTIDRQSLLQNINSQQDMLTVNQRGATAGSAGVQGGALARRKRRRGAIAARTQLQAGQRGAAWDADRPARGARRTIYTLTAARRYKITTVLPNRGLEPPQHNPPHYHNCNTVYHNRNTHITIVITPAIVA